MAFSKVDVTTQATGVVIPESNSILVINPGVGYEPYNIIANVKGRIQSLNYKNPGAVVKKGEPILTIVPQDQKLIVLGKLFVKDRGYVTVAQKFAAGKIEYILVPGIQVQIFILTGERTVLSYVTTPFHNGMGQALQER